MAIKADEATQLRHVEADLMSKFKNLPPQVVSLEIEHALAEFTSAKVRTFVPVMVQKKAADALRSQAIATRI